MVRCAPAIATFLIALVAALPIVHLWNHDYTDPHSYAGDGVITLAWVKGVLDNPWALENRYLGAPYKQEMYDFPISANVHFAALKLLGCVKHDPFWVVNVYYLLSFPLAALSMFALLRGIGVRPWIAPAFAVLFAFLPGHFWRGSNHLFLSTYFLLPLAFLPLVWLSEGELTFSRRNPKLWLSVLIAALCGSDGAYFGLFTAATVALSAVVVGFQRREKQTWLLGGTLTALFVGSFALNLAPVFAYKWREGPNPSADHVSVHDWSEGEVYGLKLTSLVVPISTHPVRAFREIRREYYEKTPLKSEADAMALGLVGSFGLFAALFTLVKPDFATERGKLLYLLGILVVVLALATTISGFATVANLLHFRSLRSYNRSSFYIAVCAFAVAAVVADNLYQRCSNRTLRAVLAVGVALLIPAGLIDQTWHKKLPVAEERLRFAMNKRHDAAFIAQVEAVAPPGAAVFQLPYISAFSQTEGRGAMFHYDHYRAYLHSKQLRWSYGGMHGRPSDRRNEFLAQQPTPRMVELLAAQDFGGIYVDRLGYADGGKALESELQSLLGASAVVSENGRLAYYDLSRFKPSLSEPDELRAVADGFPRVKWSKLVGSETRMDGRAARFVCGKFQATVTNPRSTPQRFTVAFAVKADVPRFSVLAVSHADTNRKFECFEAVNECRMEVTLPPGESTIEFAVQGAEKFGQAPGGHLHLLDFRLELPGSDVQEKVAGK